MNFEIAPKSTEVQLNWDNARLYCFALNIDGKTGWRLPTREELNEIYESRNDFDEEWYWSSTVPSDFGENDGIREMYDDNYAFVQELFNSERGFTTKKCICHVIAVRDLR